MFNKKTYRSRYNCFDVSRKIPALIAIWSPFTAFFAPRQTCLSIFMGKNRDTLYETRVYPFDGDSMAQPLARVAR